jgi:hypothetical protein
MIIKEHLHRLVDELPENQTPAAERLLEALKAGTLDPVGLALLLAPEDDEPVTQGEETAVREAREALDRGDLVSDEELRLRLNL